MCFRDIHCGYLLCSNISPAPRLGELQGGLTSFSVARHSASLDCRYKSLRRNTSQNTQSQNHLKKLLCVRCIFCLTEVLLPGCLLLTADISHCHRKAHIYCATTSSCFLFQHSCAFNTVLLSLNEPCCLFSSGAHVVIDGDTDLGYVEDGTACGTDRICFNHKCLPIQQFNFSTCPGTTDKTVCSGHGVHRHLFLLFPNMYNVMFTENIQVFRSETQEFFSCKSMTLT